jgi:hypothetical protein
LAAIAGALAVGLAASTMPALGQEAPASAAPAPVVHHPVHRPRPHHHRAHHRTAATATGTLEPQAPAPVQRPAYTDAPRPDADLLPPKEYVPPNAAVIPGTMQLHYPPSGEGYVPGSSPQAMDDARTAKVPGVTLHLPIQPTPPAPLPPPTDPAH